MKGEAGSLAIDAALVRGGTSRGLILKLQDVPHEKSALETFLLGLIGRASSSQLDGVGGMTSVTSKVMMVDPSPNAQGRHEYLFAQVSPNGDKVDFGGNCGNMTAAVVEYLCMLLDTNAVKLYNQNTSVAVDAKVQRLSAAAESEDRLLPDGQLRSGRLIETSYLNPAGGTPGTPFPTGNALDRLDLGDAVFEVSIVNVTNPVVFLKAGDLGLTGSEDPEYLNSRLEVLAIAERIRSSAAETAGIVDRAVQATEKSPGLPKLAIVSPAPRHRNGHGDAVEAQQIDLVGRMFSMQKAHPAYALTGAMCTAGSILLSGTVPNQLARRSPTKVNGTEVLRLAHPGGVIDVGVRIERPDTQGLPVIRSVSVTRTARTILSGRAFV